MGSVRWPEPVRLSTDKGPRGAALDRKLVMRWARQCEEAELLLACVSKDDEGEKEAIG